MKAFIHILTLVFVLLWTTTQAADSTQGDDIVVARPALREVVLTGFTRARATLPLVAESAGKVLRVTADIGDAVSTDGIFAKLDPTFIQLDLEGSRVQQDQLRSHIAYDQKEVERHRELLKKGSTSYSRLEALVTTLQDNQYRLAELEVQEKILEERLRRTLIRAPSGWRVTARQIEPGQRVNEGEKVGEVADFSTLLVPFALSPEQFMALRQNQETLVLRLPDWQAASTTRIYRVNPGFDPPTRKIAVDLALTGNLPEYRGGLRVQLNLALAEKTGAVILPREAVEESYEEYWVTRDNGERIPVVKLGSNPGTDGAYVRVASPRIQAGERFRLRKE